jgi:hypothetical protein
MNAEAPLGQARLRKHCNGRFTRCLFLVPVSHGVLSTFRTPLRIFEGSGRKEVYRLLGHPLLSPHFRLKLPKQNAPSPDAETSQRVPHPPEDGQKQPSKNAETT